MGSECTHAYAEKCTEICINSTERERDIYIYIHIYAIA